MTEEEREREKEGDRERKRERKLFFSCSTLQVCATARAELSQNQESEVGTPSRSATWVAEEQVFGPSSTAFPGTLAGS